MAFVFQPGIPGPWYEGGCGGPRVRSWSDGRYEIENVGFPRGSLLTRWNQYAPADSVVHWTSLINDAARKYGVPPTLIAAVMKFESDGYAKAGTPQGAHGLMQVILSTGAALLGRPTTVAELEDPAVSVDLGTKLLRQLLDKTQGNVVRTTFSYNAGGVKCGGGKAHDGSGVCAPNMWNIVADCYSANKPTVDYASAVIRYANDAALSGLFSGAPPPAPINVASVTGGSGGVLFVLLALGGLAYAASQGAFSFLSKGTRR